MTFDNHKRRPSLEVWEKKLLSAAREAGRAAGGPIPKNLTEMLKIVDFCIANYPLLAKEMSETRDEILELIRLKARRKELLKLPVATRMLHLMRDERPMSIDEAVERCLSGDYGRISERLARSVFDGFLAMGLIAPAKEKPVPGNQGGTIH